MRKDIFLNELREKLAALPQADIDKAVDYYAEMIDERIEGGMTEEGAVREIGTPDEAAAQISSETPRQLSPQEETRPRRRLRPWEIALLILGAPLWIPLSVSILAVMLSVYLVLWSCVLVLYATDLALAVSVPAAVLGGIVCLRQNGVAPAGVWLGLALICAGTAVFLFFGSNLAAKGIVRMSRAVSLRLRRKEAAK